MYILTTYLGCENIIALYNIDSMNT